MKGRYNYIIVIGLMMLCLHSCRYKDLDRSVARAHEVDVNFVWMERAVPEVSKISTYFYEVSTDTPLCFELADRFGGTVKLKEGEYKALAVNTDTPSILFRDDDFADGFVAYTRSISLQSGTQITSKVPMPKAAGTESQIVTLEPEILYGGVGNDLRLPSNDARVIEEIPMQRLTSRVTILIEDVANLEYSAQFGVSLSGLAACLQVVEAKPFGEPVIHSVPMHILDNHSLAAEINCFGSCPDNDEHILTVYAVLADGTAWYYSMDVTEQMHDVTLNPDPYDVTIRLNGLPLPKPVTDGSGFVPAVDSWNGVEIILGM